MFLGSLTRVVGLGMNGNGEGVVRETDGNFLNICWKTSQTAELSGVKTYLQHILTVKLHGHVTH